MGQQDVKFAEGKADRDFIRKIAERASDLYYRDTGQVLDAMTVQMDLAAVHANGCPLYLATMEGARDFDLMHDVLGINRHLDRDTGKLDPTFSPRFAIPRTAQDYPRHG